MGAAYAEGEDTAGTKRKHALVIFDGIYRMTPPETRGMLAVIVAFLLFAGVDTVARFLSPHFHPIQLVWARYASQMALVLIILAPRLPRLVRTAHPGLQLIRSAMLFGSW